MSASCPVWVGGLSLGVNESILLELFSKFGPVKNAVILRDDSGKSKQCGFVNFLSLDAANAAAFALNGCDILGETIKTRGPAELLGKEKSLNTAKNERKDCRALTDCIYFLSGKDCQLKTGECPFRHNKKSQQTELVCPLWLQKKCLDVNCAHRHPHFTKPPSNEPTIVQPPRCPSHNAFKCTGECGFANCETHFMEQESMQDHINKGRQRNVIPSSACSQCKAIFFSEEERTNHMCFSNHVNMSAIPTVHTSQQEPCKQCPSNSEAQCGCSQSTSKVAQLLPRHLSICSSCGTCYENSGDSLSSIDGSVKSPCRKGGHACPNSPSVRMATGKENGNYAGDPEPIGVFWDIENCPVPRGRSALDVVQKIRKEFFGGCREVEFMCVCDISKEKREVIEELNKAQVTVVHINATSKNAADDKLRQSLRRFAQSYSAPASVILVSGDINFAAELSDLRHRHNLRVICLHNAQAQNALLTCAHEAHRFDHFTADLPITSTVKTDEDTVSPSELKVLNLPLGKDTAQVRMQLRKLSDNCGGKVVSVTGRCAVVRFPNALSAARAKKRMDKENVFGSTIQVVYSAGDVGRICSPNRMKKRTEEPKLGASNGNTTAFRLLQREKVIVPEREHKSGSALVNVPDLRAPVLNDRNPLATVNIESSNGPVQSKLPEENKEQCESKLNAKQAMASQHFVNQPGFPGYPNMWSNHYYHGMLNIPPQASGIPGITPLAGPIVGAPSHLTASWLANLHNLSLLEQQRGGIDLLVTNLDETVNKKDLKRKLASIFREHCKVYSVILHSGKGIPLRAFIKVPKLTDANLAVAKVNQQQIFGTTVTVTIATEKEKDLCFLRCEVTSILKETPLHWTPLNKFLSEYYEKCSKSFDTNALNLIQDLVLVNGTPGNQTISLVTCAVATVPIKVEFELFAWEVHELLKGHTGEVNIAAFAALYWLKYDKVVEVDQNGIALEDVLKKVPNVMVSSKENETKFVTWIKQGTRNGGNLNKLLEFSTELKDLLRLYPSFKLSVSSLISEYQTHYDKKEPFNPYVYGLSSVTDLLEALPSVVEISDRSITLTREMRLQTFEEELRFLLESQPDKCLLLGEFMAMYRKCYGRKCRVSSYGFNRLVELLESFPTIVKIHGTGEHQVIHLVGKAKTQMFQHDDQPKTDIKAALQVLSSELKEILKEKTGHLLPISEVMVTYYQRYKRHMKVGELGFRHLPELLQALPGLQVTEKDGTLYLLIPPRMTLKSVASDVLGLLEQQEGHFVLVKDLPSVYRKMYNRKFPVGQIKLEELVHALGSDVLLKGSSLDRILLLSANESSICQKRKRLAKKVAVVLMKYPECKVPFTSFNDLFYKQYGHHIKPKDFQCRDLTTLLNEMRDVVEVFSIGYTKMKEVCLKRKYALQVFANEIIKVLSSQHVLEKALELQQFENEYNKIFGRKMMYRNCGFTSLRELLKLMPSVVKVSSSGLSTQVQLSSIQIFALETSKLLSLCDGCVSLNRFAPAYQQHYGKPCKACDYGYNRIIEVVNAIPHVVRTVGKGSEKMVVLTEGDLILDVKQTLRTSSRPSSRQEVKIRVESPVDGYESDSESVELEKEIYKKTRSKAEESSSCRKQINDEIDLINFANGNGYGTLEPQCSPVNDWLSGPVPDGVPQPHIKPDLTYTMPVGDLISFTEFDTEHFLTGLSEIRQRKERIQSVSCEADCISDREDIEVATINSMSNDTGSQCFLKNKERSISDPGQLEALQKNALPSYIVMSTVSTDYSTPQMIEHDVCTSETKGEILQDCRQISKHTGKDYSVPQKFGNGHSKLSQSNGVSGDSPINLCSATTESTPKETTGAIKEMKKKKSSAPKIRLAVNFSPVLKK